MQFSQNLFHNILKNINLLVIDIFSQNVFQQILLFSQNVCLCDAVAGCRGAERWCGVTARGRGIQMCFFYRACNSHPLFDYLCSQKEYNLNKL